MTTAETKEAFRYWVQDALGASNVEMETCVVTDAEPGMRWRRHRSSIELMAQGDGWKAGEKYTFTAAQDLMGQRSIVITSDANDPFAGIC